MPVTFEYRNGRKRHMSRRYADILQKLGHGTYMTRAMQAQVDEPDTQSVIDKKPAKKITKAAK